MFSTANYKDILDEVYKFIELSPLEFVNKEEELTKGIQQVITVLDRNPIDILNVIAKIVNNPDEPYTPPSIWLFQMLDEKMRMKKCHDKLGVLYEKCLSELVEACVYNKSDL